MILGEKYCLFEEVYQE